MNFHGLFLTAELFFLHGKLISGIFGKGKAATDGVVCRPQCHHVLRPIGCQGRHTLVTAHAYKSWFRPERFEAPTANLKPHLAASDCLYPHASVTFIFSEELARAGLLSEAPTALSEVGPTCSCRVPAAASSAPSSKHLGSHAAASFSLLARAPSVCSH
jgi:hypothetical protein